MERTGQPPGVAPAQLMLILALLGCQSSCELAMGGKSAKRRGRRIYSWSAGYYHGHGMASKDSGLEELQASGESALAAAAAQLHDLLAELALRLRPFPSFLEMVSLHAVELDPPVDPTPDRGCVVVLPDGEIVKLDLTAVPGIQGVRDIDQVEEFKELELPPEEYILYASTAIQLLCQELHRRETDKNSP